MCGGVLETETKTKADRKKLLKTNHHQVWSVLTLQLKYIATAKILNQSHNENENTFQDHIRMTDKNNQILLLL